MKPSLKSQVEDLRGVNTSLKESGRVSLSQLQRLKQEQKNYESELSTLEESVKVVAEKSRMSKDKYKSEIRDWMAKTQT